MQLEDFKSYDTWVDKSYANNMVTFINNILPGRIVLTGVFDEGSRNLTADVIKAL